MKLINLTKKDFENILSNYNIGNYISSRHIWLALQNTVFTLKTTKGKYILKVFERSDLDFINYQVNIIDFLIKKRIPIPEVMKTRSKKNLLIYNKKRILIQKFIDGGALKNVNDKILLDITKVIGRMDFYLSQMKMKGKYVWEKDHEFKPIEYGCKQINNLNFVAEEKNYLREVQSLNKQKLKRSTIHGDICEPNFLVGDNKIKAIIDWDDVHEDYVVMEIAVFISHLLVTTQGIKENQLKKFIAGYQKYIKINEEDKKALYYFIKYRYLGAIAWCARYQRIHKEKKEKIEEWINHLVKKYFVFSKISLDEFLELIE